MKKNIKKTVAAMSLTVFAAGCGSAPGNLSAGSGSERLVWTNGSGVSFESVHSSSVNDVGAQAVYINLQLAQTAQLASPTVNGAVLQANAIEVVGNRAYVAYNTQGVGYGGGVDVINITSMTAPVMTSTATYADRDFAGLKRDTFDLYAASSSNANGAELVHFNLGLLGDLNGAPDVIPVVDSSGNSFGAVATGVGFWNGNIFVSTGEYGGLAVFNRNNLLDIVTGLLVPNQVPALYPIKDARGVAVNALGDVHVVTGYSATGGSTTNVADHQYVYSSGGTPASIRQFSTDSWTTTDDEAKSAIVSGLTLDLLTAGEAGIKLVCKASGNTIQQVANPSVSGISSAALTAANAVTFGAGLVYVSNGAGGISVYSLEQGASFLTNPCSVSLQYQGRILFEDGASVNNVYYTLGKLIVATGTNGFRLVNVTALNALGLVSSL